MNTCPTKDTATRATTSSQSTAASYTKPHYHTKETENGYNLRVYVPGADKSGITLSLDKGVITVAAKHATVPNEAWRVVSQELPSKDYRLLLQVDNKIDAERIAAHLENGVLEVTLPFKEAAQPRVIEVN